MGCEVSLLDETAVAAGDYSRFDAVVTGVRAWNTRAELRLHQKKLWDYVHAGGTAVVQYNVMDGLFWSNEAGTLRTVGPYPFKTSRDRITVEDTPVRILKPDHPLLNSPNRIGPEDFQGWVQERGLYFPADPDPRYETLLEMSDPGEKPLAGGILTAPWKRRLRLYAACVLPSVARRRAGRLPAVRQSRKCGTIDEAVNDEPPPILGSWRRLYGAVLIFLVTIIAGFTLFTRMFNR